MTVGKAIYNLLLSNADLRAIVDTRIFPEVAQQDAVLPYVVYNVSSNEPSDTKREPSKLDTAQIEVNLYSTSYTECIDMATHTRAALDRVTGTYSGVNVQSIQYLGEIIDFDEAQRTYNITADYDVRISRTDFEIAQGSPITGVTLGELSDVDVTGVTDGQLIAYDAAAQEWQPADDAGGVTELGQLTDVDIIAPEQGDVLSYNAGVQEWMVNGGLQELLTRFKASGTGAQMYDTLNDTTKGYIDILAASATMKVNHSGMTISEASPGVLSFSVAAGTEGNEVEFEAMTIEGSDAFSTVADITFKPGALTYWENATGKIWLRAPNAGNLTVLLPSSSGTIALTTDIPSVPVDSVNGQTGVVVLDTGDIDENGNLYYTEARVAANSAVAANTAKVGVIAGGTTGQALVKASGTDYDTEWADIAIDTQYHNRFQTDAETFRSGATETVELYYTAKADGDGLAESASSDTPTAGKIIKRKIYYSEAAFADPDTGTWVEFTPAPADDASFATVKAALLEYLKARTGGTVPISLKQTWEEADEANLLLDTYTGAAAAYSLRKLRTAYTGDAVEVYNGSSYADIGFNVFGELDTVALAAHCGSNDGFVSKWYCQSGNSNDAVQTNTGSMPKIYDGTTGVVTENGKPAVDFDGSNNWLDLATNQLGSTELFADSNDAFSVYQYATIDTQGTVFSKAVATGANRDYQLYYQNEWAYYIRGAFTLTGITDKRMLSSFNWDGSNAAANFNGTSQTVNIGTAGKSTQDINIGARSDGSFLLDGKNQEIIVYDSSKSASDRTGIESNIATFYDITI